MSILVLGILKMVSSAHWYCSKLCQAPDHLSDNAIPESPKEQHQGFQRGPPP